MLPIGFSIKTGILCETNFFAWSKCNGVGVAITTPSGLSNFSSSSIELNILHLKFISFLKLWSGYTIALKVISLLLSIISACFFPINPKPMTAIFNELIFKFTQLNLCEA